jgi:hypothetical protein
MPDTEKKDGWGFPLLSKKAHYFSVATARSLCGRWAYTGEYEQGNDNHPINCAECRRRLRVSAAMRGTR